VIGVVMTSEPDSNPSAIMLTCSAAVQEFTAATCEGCSPWYVAKLRSNCATRGPVPSHADSMHATTSSISACSIRGEPKIRNGSSGFWVGMVACLCLNGGRLSLSRLAFPGIDQPFERGDLSIEPPSQVHAPQLGDL